jgi:NAD(P)-dependent dehydrogenase (short-subunit alcohol dehydrogenase family)
VSHHLSPRPLDGVGALVTGGGSGIGLAIARLLAADGATVTICGRTEERLRAAVDGTDAGDGGGSLHAVVADVTDEDSVAAAVAAAEAHAGGALGAVVANAGGSESIGSVADLDLDAWLRTVDQNLHGTYRTLKHGARSLVRGGGGAFVAVSSIAAQVTHPWFGAYGPAKAAINQLCRQAADELGPSNVRVNAVCPGLIDTELVAGISGPGPVLDSYLENTPLGRVGEPGDVASLVRFLVGPESSWLTGQCIAIDGGHTLRRGPSLRGVLEPFMGDDALRGVVAPAD